MKREDLKDLELSKEVIDKIMELHGKDIESTKAKTEEKIKSDYEKQISERDKQLEELKKVDVTAYEQKIKEIQEENLKSKTDFENQLKQTKIDLSIENALIKAGAKDAKLLKSMIATDKIIIDNEKTIGLDEQLADIKKSHGWAFADDQTTITTGQPQQPNTIQSSLADAINGKMFGSN
jgi:hypothetical protein